MAKRLYAGGMSGLRALLFDVFGTVVDWRASLIAELSEFGTVRRITVDWPALVDAWCGDYRPSLERVRRGEQPWAVLDALHRASLQALAPRFGLSGLAPADLDHLTRAWHRLNPWPDALPGLNRLRRHWTIAALSNGNVALLVNMARRAGLPWDMVFGADLFRQYKPDPETYRGACTLLGLAPRQVMMVAAHPSDLEGARAAGLRTAFVPRPEEYGAETAPADAAGPWDVTATDFVDLAWRLEAGRPANRNGGAIVPAETGGPMVEIRRLNPHDPMPEGEGTHIIVLRRFDEDQPRQRVVDLIVSRGARGVETSHPVRPDGTPASFEEALSAARRVAAEIGLTAVYAIDRTAGPREREVIEHHGDHSFAGDALDDFDLEEDERGTDLRDRSG